MLKGRTGKSSNSIYSNLNVLSPYNKELNEIAYKRRCLDDSGVLYVDEAIAIGIKS